MIIKRSEQAGFCFGVRSIDERTQETLKRKADFSHVYSYGTLIHNAQYVARRRQEGLEELTGLSELSRLDDRCAVILRAHGVTKTEREQLGKTGATIIDGTCPVLLGIYRLGQQKNREGYRIAIVGDPNHPEIIAMRSYFDERTVVLHTIEEAETFFSEAPLFVLSQTTNRPEFFNAMVEALRTHNTVSVRNTICHATQDRQQAAAELAKEVDCMVVIGGKHSSNTQKLVQVAEKTGKYTLHIEVLEDLPLQKVQNFNTIGVTAGASTPDWIIEEVVEGMDNLSNEEFMEQVEGSMIKIYPKDIVKGTVIAVKDDEVFVDIKFRADGIIKTDEMTDGERADTHSAFHEGEEIDVYVIKLDDGEGNVVLSTRRVEGLKNWQKLVDQYEAAATVEAKVTGENTGGLVVNVMGINGFIPASQITTYYVKNFKQFIGETLECKIISIDEKKRRVVLSSRALKEEQLDAIWEGIVVGERVKGTVVRMTEFGAFVDLGGVDGLIHVSDISWDRVGKPSDVLEIGQEVEPIVLKANRERNRISLGLKQLAPKPFELFFQNNKVGDVVSGTVVNLLDFGAFVRLPEGVEGLVHVSQISNHHVEKPSDELTVGNEVQVKILEIDAEKQRIALSIRALQEPPVAQESSAPAERPQRDDSRFERKPKKERKVQQPRPEQERVSTISFDTSSDIGTNLGDLISAKLNLLDLDDSFAEEPAEEAEETPTEE
ncbi:MAG: bifunctional 4-hydroxy-3-methylbut-2-enyl diphosphate reductase/30S ribosomal protein S1 [Ndongobacter sp.]|nr:bifunctional 4-hydroxy-3-methylbut-2-enyl diphosphate reductase/30S ribosomal protein S1 [Ndongobacter sp.]